MTREWLRIGHGPLSWAHGVTKRRREEKRRDKEEQRGEGRRGEEKRRKGQSGGVAE